jgi:hypothetical protein
MTDDDVQQIVQTSARRIIRLCAKRGLLDDTQADLLNDQEPVLAAITSASIRASSPPENALANGCDEFSGIRPKAFARDGCALPRAVSPCMRQPGSLPKTVWGSSSRAAMLPDRPWQRADCASSMPTSSPAP